ncbi:hypothetical protein [Psychrobacillus sp. L3]|uniref:hypothetical protein n=1 Tax=Psychrobacillus sp. L3 TaxID=3236891 RepID=UPI0036F3B65E
MLQKNKGILYLLITTLIVLLSGCNNSGKLVKNNYFLPLHGESQTWSLTGYEVMITPENFKAGNGTLKMKNEEKYLSDFFQFETHAVINNEDFTVHSNSIEFSSPETGDGIDIAEITTGAIESGKYLNEKGDPISLKEVNVIYMIVKWRDINKGAYANERIDLFVKPNKEETFLN